MSITVTCPNPDCGRTIRAKDDYAGRQVKCPACGRVVAIPYSPRIVQDDDVPGFLGETAPSATAPARERRADDETKVCPFCAETIKAAALKCKHCGSMLTDTQPARADSRRGVLVDEPKDSTRAPEQQESWELVMVQASRWGEALGGTITGMFYPRTAALTREVIMTKAVRSILMPWVIEEETMPWSKVASYRHCKGILWDKVIIETSGGSNDLSICGLRKAEAARFVAALDRRLRKEGIAKRDTH